MVEEATPPPRKVEGYDETTDRNGWIDAASPFPYNDKIETLGARKITPISISMAIYHIFMIFRPVATVLSRKKNYDHAPSKFYPMAVDFFGLFSRISIQSLQALLLLAVQILLEPAGVDMWTLSHVAMAHCIDLGFHREPGAPSAELSAVGIAVRRLIFDSLTSQKYWI